MNLASDMTLREALDDSTELVAAELRALRSHLCSRCQDKLDRSWRKIEDSLSSYQVSVVESEMLDLRKEIDAFTAVKHLERKE